MEAEDARQAEIEAERGQEKLAVREIVARAFPDADEVYMNWFEKAYIRLESPSIDRKRFASLRKHGYEKLANLSMNMEDMSDELVTVVLSSDLLKALVTKALYQCPDEDIVSQLEQILASGGPSTVHAMETYCGGLLDDDRTVREGEFRRIVLVAGDLTTDRMASALVANTDLEVKAVTGSMATRPYLKSVIRDGDLVVIATSHIGHIASGSAIMTARNFGIPFLIRRQTNVDFILRRLGQASPES